MRYLISLLFLVPVCAHAQQGTQNVHIVYSSTNTIIQTATLCVTDGATIITAKTSSGTLAGYQAIEVYNPDTSTTTAVCGFDPMLSTQTWSAWYGIEISTVGANVPNVSRFFYTPSSSPLYCETKNSSGCQPITVIQYK